MMHATTRPFRAAQPEPALRLCCFPYAGGEARIFRTWQSLLPSWVEVLPFEYPGHGTRAREPLLERMSALVEDVARALRALSDRPLVLFGYSLGALVAYEAARHLAQGRDALVARLIVAACTAPPKLVAGSSLHTLDQDSFFCALERRYGASFPALRNRELRDFYWPVFKNDFALFESYQYQPARPLDCPVDAYGGLDDARVSREDLEAWRAITRAPFRTRLFAGKHFFVHSAESTLVNALGRAVAESEHVARGLHE